MRTTRSSIADGPAWLSLRYQGQFGVGSKTNGEDSWDFKFRIIRSLGHFFFEETGSHTMLPRLDSNY